MVGYFLDRPSKYNVNKGLIDNGLDAIDDVLCEDVCST